MQGILATHIYECGFTALDDGPSDVFGTILGKRFSPERVLDGLGTEYRIQQNYFKFYACCQIWHRGVGRQAQKLLGKPGTGGDKSGSEHEPGKHVDPRVRRRDSPQPLSRQVGHAGDPGYAYL